MSKQHRLTTKDIFILQVVRKQGHEQNKKKIIINNYKIKRATIKINQNKTRNNLTIRNKKEARNPSNTETSNTETRRSKKKIKNFLF